MKVNFYTETLLSELDLTTLGGSSKRGNKELVGEFCSGLKYAIAILNRHNVKFSAHVKTNQSIEGFDRDVEINYHVGTYFKEDEQTGKTKELLKISKTSSYQNFHSAHTIDEWGGDYDEELETGISVELGFDWKLQYALRELWANMVDEKGTFDTSDKPQLKKQGTLITLEFDDESEFADIWRNKDLYFITDEPLITFESYSNKVELRKTTTEFLRIYKQGILVYEDKETESKYTYNLNFGELDERRILNNIYSIKNTIASTIIYSKSDECIDFLLNMVGDEADVFSKDILYEPTVSQKMVDKVSEMEGNITTFNFVLEALKKMPNSPLKDRKIKTLKESVWEVQKTVEIQETPKQIEVIEEKKEVISILKSKYNFEFQFPIKEATLKGSVVVADKFNKLLIISKDFSVDNQEHMIEFFIQYFDLSNDGKGNVLKKMSEAFIGQIKK